MSYEELKIIKRYVDNKGFDHRYKDIVKKLENGFNLGMFYKDWISYIFFWVIPPVFIWSVAMSVVGIIKDRQCWQCYPVNTFLWVFYGIVNMLFCYITFTMYINRYERLSVLDYFTRTFNKLVPQGVFLVNFTIGFVSHVVFLSISDYFLAGNIIGIVVNIMLLVLNAWIDDNLAGMYKESKYYDRPPPYIVEIQPPPYPTCAVNIN